jgi:polar amino acid transport system permease protein
VSDWSPSARELERRGVRRRIRTRQALIATAATVLFFTALVTVVMTSPGWPSVDALFFDGFHAKQSFDAILEGFWINVQLFMLCQPVILVVALAVALARTARSPWLLPVRLLGAFYVDVFRGTPTILLILLLAFGMPALRLQGLPDSTLFWCRGQTLRFVVVPQAVRRVIPPLLNDFVSLQKDTALVAAAGVFDALFAARDYGNFNFNYTPLVVVAGFYVAMTLPLARYCDWLQRRWMERERAGAL